LQLTFILIVFNTGYPFFNKSTFVVGC